MPTGEFVSFHFGEQQDYAKDDTVDLSEVEIGLGFDWQSSNPKVGTGFQVVEGTVHCQCVFNFCSTECLRKFMNSMVDNLEGLMKREQAQPGAHRPPNSPSAPEAGGR